MFLTQKLESLYGSLLLCTYPVPSRIIMMLIIYIIKIYFYIHVTANKQKSIVPDVDILQCVLSTRRKFVWRR